MPALDRTTAIFAAAAALAAAGVLVPDVGLAAALLLLGILAASLLIERYAPGDSLERHEA